ncbi:MAG: carboxypeptidase regulatory-like domain-containing protein, partial [Vicinamibacterales bacterium]
AGSTTVADVTVPSFAAVRVTAKRLDGTPLAGVGVYVIDSRGQSPSSATNAAGVAFIQTYVAEGPFTVTLFFQGTLGTGTGVILPTDDNQTVDITVVSNAASISGFVLEGDGVTPLTSGLVQMALNGSSIAASNIAANGAYTINVLPPGTYTAFVTSPGRTFQVPGIVVNPGEAKTQNLKLPAIATLRVTAHRTEGAPIANALVYYDTGLGYINAGFTNASGVVTVPNLSEGQVRILVYGFNGITFTASRTATIAASDNGQIVELDVAVSVGNIAGHVYAADGVSPAPGASVTLIDPQTNSGIAGTATDEFGAYALSNVGLESATFIIQARSPGRGDIVVDVTSAFSGDPTVVDVTLPIGLVRGTVFNADGVTPAASASVTLAQQDPGGDAIFLYGTADEAGVFSIAGVVPGAFDILARDQSGLIEGRASGTLADVVTVVTANVQLAPTTAVSGTVRDASGNPVVFGTVTLWTDGTLSDYNTSTSTNEVGGFTFERVPSGGVTVQSCTNVTSWVCGTSGAVIAGAAVVVDIAIPATGTVSGTVRAADGLTPVPNAPVSVSAGFGGGFVYADANGHYLMTDVQAGLVTVITYDPQTFAILGTKQGTMTVGGNLVIDLTQGVVAPCNPLFTGTDGFVYPASCGGELRGGGTEDGRLRQAYGPDAYKLRLNGTTVAGLASVQMEMNDRQAVYQPFDARDLLATRKLFVPTSGGFARYLDTLSNTSNVPVTVSVQVESSLGGVVRTIVDPASTNNTYAVTLSDPTTQSLSEESPAVRPALAHVFAGTGTPLPVTALRIQRLIGPTFYRWIVTVPAGQSVTLMHFAVQREPTDTAGATAQANALANLTDPNALSGMTAEEKARVVNFVIP